MGQVLEMGDRLKIFRQPWHVDIHRDDMKLQRQIAAAREHASQQRAKRCKRLATWADRKAIKAFYLEAQKLTVETGVLHEVDHIIPLLGEFVSGLHVENNLQVVPQLENRKKSNRYSHEIEPGLHPGLHRK